MTPKKRKKDVEAAEAGVEEQDASVAEEVDEDPPRAPSASATRRSQTGSAPALTTRT